MEDDPTGRQPERKRTSQEDDLTGRQPHEKTTSHKDNLARGQPQRKTTLTGRKPYRKKLHRNTASHDKNLKGRKSTRIKTNMIYVIGKRKSCWLSLPS